MQALERIDFSNNWTTLVYILCLFLLFVLKSLDPHKLFKYSKAYFLKGFIEKNASERTAVFSAFNILFYAYSVLIYSVFFTYITAFFSSKKEVSFQQYLKILAFVFCYYSFFKLLDFLISNLFEIQHEVSNLIAAKLGYSYHISLLLFPFLLLTTYSFFTIYALLSVFFLLFIVGFVFSIINNKNLIISKLFYFILYLCALEIMPLLIIYKITA